MKIIRRILAAGLSLAMLAPAGAQAANPEPRQMRGVWVSSVYNLDYPAKTTTSADALKSEADRILDNCVKTGLNTVFFQPQTRSMTRTSSHGATG